MAAPVPFFRSLFRVLCRTIKVNFVSFNAPARPSVRQSIKQLHPKGPHPPP
jgi:hypothetical protein